MMGLPEAYAHMSATDTLDAKISAIDAKELLQRADIADALNEPKKADASNFDGLSQEYGTDMNNDGLPEAYASIAADDKLEAVLARADAQEVRDRSAIADMVQDSNAAMASDDRYEAALAKADARAPWRCTDTKECAQDTSIIENLPKAYAAIAEDEKFEAVLAHADMRHLQCRSDAAKDTADQQLWAAGLPKAFEDAAENDKLEVTLASPATPELACDEDDGHQSPLKRQKMTGGFTRQESECSTTVPDGFARQFSADSPTMAF